MSEHLHFPLLPLLHLRLEPVESVTDCQVAAVLEGRLLLLECLVGHPLDSAHPLPLQRFEHHNHNSHNRNHYRRHHHPNNRYHHHQLSLEGGHLHNHFLVVLMIVMKNNDSDGDTSSLFSACSRFEGNRPGCVFKLGCQGLGYYYEGGGD